MTRQEYYQQNTERYHSLLKQLKTRRNLITTAKLLTFAGMITLIYLLIERIEFPLLPAAILLIILFIVLTIIDIRIVYRQHKTEELIRINTIEKNYLDGDLSAFPDGSSYQDATHPYASDLDLFGEESLFQHLNRTATASGTEKLVTWLLHLSKDATIIRERQQAIAELCDLPDWCQEFRALGKLHPTKDADTRILNRWQKKTAFFVHPLSVRIPLYISNSITLSTCILGLTGLIPWSLALLPFLLQLFVLAFFLKKINAYHEELSLFIRSIGNYLPFVKWIASGQFHSPLLRSLRGTLLNKDCNALQALSALHKIQNHLDQRANVLLAFVLNGLYMKDLHIILRLDKWKKEYVQCIDSWIDAVSEWDALVSMATYRFNHPAYCVPEITDAHLLDAREAGHPLLKGSHCIANDFHLDKLHQFYITTGANMAGKSTFLRTIGLNLVLAQSGNVVRSSSFSFQPMALFTSMRTTDNLAKDTSYFHAELLRLKQLVTTATQEERLFIILDEMLKGTNSVDKLNGSLAFLQKILTYPISGLVATHDLALGKLSHLHPDHFFNVCFEITHSGSDITYDYKLHPGISTTMNASILLKQMGLI